MCTGNNTGSTYWGGISASDPAGLSRYGKSKKPGQISQMAPVELLVTHLAFLEAMKQKERSSTGMCSSEFGGTVYPEGWQVTENVLSQRSRERTYICKVAKVNALRVESGLCQEENCLKFS